MHSNGCTIDSVSPTKSKLHDYPNIEDIYHAAVLIENVGGASNANIKENIQCSLHIIRVLATLVDLITSLSSLDFL